jgi:methyltransferase
MIVSITILALVTAQRLGELVLARGNTARLRAMGGIEHGAGHYPLIVGLHAAWLAGLWGLAWSRPVQPAWLIGYLVLQGLRAWTLLSLGRRWTTRIITVPGEAPVRLGPYRFLPHPNYLVVVGEIAVLPMVFGLWVYALAFSLLNAAVLAIRLRAETTAWRGAAEPSSQV